MKRLILGDGLLGSNMALLTGWDYVSRKKNGIDFTKPSSYDRLIEGYDEIINCIAHTDTYDEDRQKHWAVNYAAVASLVALCNSHKQKLIHISTDYVYSNSIPCAKETDVPSHCANWYGYTKLLADGYIQLCCNRFLILRGSFKKTPFIYEKALAIQIGNFDYVDKIVGLMVAVIKSGECGIVNVGTDVKTMYELAKQTKENVVPMFDSIHHTMPTNVTMDTTKLKCLLDKDITN